jgi:PAS domain S-box-containing protein
LKLIEKMQSPTLKNIAIFALLVAVYFLTGKLSEHLTFLNSNWSALWIPAGIALSAFLVLGYRIWPAILVGSFLVDVTAAASLGMAIGIAVVNTLEALVGAYLVNRYARGSRAFSKPQDVFRFTVFAGILATALGATAGVTLLCQQGLAGWPEFGAAWLAWWAGDAVSVLVLTPFLVLLLANPHHPLDLNERLEVLAWSLGVIAVCLTVFGPTSHSWNGGDSLAFLCIPFSIWAAFRFCQLEAAGINLLLCGIVVWGSLHGYGPFANSKHPSLLLETFVAIATSMTMAVAAAIAQHRRSEEELLGLQALLQDKVEERTRDLAAAVERLTAEVAGHAQTERALRESNERFRQLAESIADVFWLLDAVEERILYVSPAFETIWGRPRESLYADTHSWLDAVHPEDHEKALVFFNRHTRENKLEAEYRIQRPDGSVRWIWDRGFVIRDESGRMCRIAGLATDVTEKQMRKEQLRETQQSEPSDA